MTLADCSFGAFAILNSARLLGYFPQIISVHRDTAGAKAVSISTWLLFAAANIATVSYALLVANDLTMAIIFSLNTAGCLAILALTTWKRFAFETKAKSGALNEMPPEGPQSRRSSNLAKMADRVVLHLLHRICRGARTRPVATQR